MNKLIINRNCGFFSDFLTTLAGIMYFKDNNQKFYVEWYNHMYCDFPNENLYDKYFNQPYELETISSIFTDTTPYGYYFPEAIRSGLDDLTILNNLKSPSQTLIDLNLTNTEIFNRIDKNYFKGLKTLGVQRRGTDHSIHGVLLSDETILSNINEEFKTNSYDKVFLMTDDNNSLNFFKQELGNTLIHTNSTRGDSQVGLHFSNLPNKTKLAEEVITDSVLLSLTDFKLVTRSNVSTFSLIYNLNENFRYMDKHIHYS
jgi:hypothetical protein